MEEPKMTFKSIVENIIEREARQALEKVLESQNSLEFGAVDLQDKDKIFQNFAVDFTELEKPYTHRVIGFIDRLGQVKPTYYRLCDEAQWYDITSGAAIR
jgi:hypothetical protein